MASKILSVPPKYVQASIWASFGALLFGYDTGIIGPVTVMPQFIQTFGHLSETAHGAVVSSILIPAATTALFGGHLADSIGRVRAMALGGGIFGLGTALEAASVHLAMLIIGRGIAGIGEGFFLSTISVYITEISPPKTRGILCSIPQFFITFGLCAGYFICYGFVNLSSSLSWRFPFALQSLLSFIFMITTLFILPQSPRWLTSVNRKQEASEVWEKLQVSQEDRQAIVDDSVQTMQLQEDLTCARTSSAAVSLRIHSKWQTLLQVFAPDVWKRTALGVFLNATQQLSGIDGVLYYAPTLFINAGLGTSSSSFLASGISALLIFATTIPAVLLADHWGRRTSILIGGILQAIAMITIGSMYAARLVSEPDSTVGKWIVVVMIYLFTIAFSGTWAVTIRVYTTEVQPARTRAAATSLAQSVNWAANFLVALTTPVLLTVNPFALYFVFGGFSLVNVLVCFFQMPETKGRSLEDIEHIFKKVAN